MATAIYTLPAKPGCHVIGDLEFPGRALLIGRGLLVGDEDVRRVIDADSVVGRRMHDQQRLVQLGDMRHQRLLGDVVEEFALDVEGPACKPDLHLASISGGTDILGCFLIGNPVLPVVPGELQCKSLVTLRQGAVADHIGEHDGGELALFS